MKIVIAGGGKVGSVLCSELATQENDIILIEKMEMRLDKLISTYDISGIVGNGASYDIQQEAGVADCDIFIAVTAQDEVNIMASILAKKLGAKYTIARVRNPEYSGHFDYVRESLGINLMINPELESARSIARIIKFPTVLSIQSFADNRVELIEIEIGSTVSLADLSLADFRKKFGDVLVCAIRRKNETLIPSGQDRLLVGDHAYIIGNRATIRKFYRTVCPQKTKINSALVIGGGRLTYYLLDFLKEYRMDIKVIEQSRQTAEELSAAYPNVEVILGDGTDQDVLQQEGIETYNAFISLIGVDEKILSLHYMLSNKMWKK